jgi:hypothetical protein
MGTCTKDHCRPSRKTGDRRVLSVSLQAMKLRDLRPILDEAFEIFGDKNDYVVAAPQYRAAANTAMGWKNANLLTELRIEN